MFNFHQYLEKQAFQFQSPSTVFRVLVLFESPHHVSPLSPPTANYGPAFDLLSNAHIRPVDNVFKFIRRKNSIVSGIGQFWPSWKTRPVHIFHSPSPWRRSIFRRSHMTNKTRGEIRNEFDIDKMTCESDCSSFQLS